MGLGAGAPGSERGGRWGRQPPRDQVVVNVLVPRRSQRVRKELPGKAAQRYRENRPDLDTHILRRSSRVNEPEHSPNGTERKYKRQAQETKAKPEPLPGQAKRGAARGGASATVDGNLHKAAEGKSVGGHSRGDR